MPYRDPSRCRAGRRPAPGTTGHSEPEAGLAQPKRRGRLPRGFLWPTRRPGNPPVFMKSPSRGAWRCKRGRRRSLPLAVRTKRNAGKRGAPKPCSRPLPDDRHAAAAAWVGSRKASKGTLAAFAAAPPVSRSEGSGIAHQHSATPRPPRGRVMRTPGRGRSCFAPARRVSMPYRFGPVPAPTAPVPAKADATNRAAGHGCDPPRQGAPTAPCPGSGGANPVRAESVRRRTRPSRSSGAGVGRTGRCAGTRPRPGCR